MATIHIHKVENSNMSIWECTKCRYRWIAEENFSCDFCDSTFNITPLGLSFIIFILGAILWLVFNVR